MSIESTALESCLASGSDFYPEIQTIRQLQKEIEAGAFEALPLSEQARLIRKMLSGLSAISRRMVELGQNEMKPHLRNLDHFCIAVNGGYLRSMPNAERKALMATLVGLLLDVSTTAILAGKY
ncbi:hypothetical protein [Aquibaculum sediminis]|uniref:hypothetical protein n=1 Tax=Aquibaculum sediminis TaxID=3231907 RepID=UPI0034524118